MGEGYYSSSPQKASINVTDNNRNITVMPPIGKVLESILNARLVFQNLTLDIDDLYQFGFKANARTSDNLFILQSLLNRQKFKNKPLYMYVLWTLQKPLITLIYMLYIINY